MTWRSERFSTLGRIVVTDGTSTIYLNQWGRIQTISRKSEDPATITLREAQDAAAKAVNRIVRKPAGFGNGARFGHRYSNRREELCMMVATVLNEAPKREPEEGS